jgi:2-keto-3-deoxy-galactonokinase
MRGEEALCLGLVAQKRVRGAATVLSLGSHWKTIQLDEQARIAGTVTSMSGELIQAAQTETILASAVPHRRAAALDRGWAEAGMGEQRRSGLSRALFCVRLLEQRSESTAEERLAFMVGAFIGADLDAMTASGMLRADRPLFIAGTLAETWRLALGKNWSAAVVLSDQEAESAFLAGLRAVAAACSVG